MCTPLSEFMKRKISPKQISNLKPNYAPDKPGDTIVTTIRIRKDQRQWLEEQEQSNGYLVRIALDLLMNTLNGNTNQNKDQQL